MTGGGDDRTRTLDDADVTQPGSGRGAPVPQVGATIGRYRLLEELGRGGMGVVYLAHDPDLDRRIALKVVARDAGGGSDGEARLVREARAMAQVHHPNVVVVHDVGISEHRVYIAMERIQGVTLRDWAARGPSLRGLIHVLALAGRGLAAAHAAGVVHRDFKPENVLVGDDGSVRVADFGLARPTGDAGEAAGTPPYMAPEQHDDSDVTAASDQFALAVSLWELAFGARPFDGASIADLAAAKRAHRPIAPRVAPRWLVSTLRRALAPDPAARHPSCAALVGALEAGLARRRRAVVGAAAGTLVATGVAAALLVGGATSTTGRTCDDGDARWSKAWSPARAAQLRAAFGARRPHAAATATRIAATLDDYGARWITATQTSCRAADDPRTRCLAAAARAVDATVATLIEAPLADTIDDADTIVAALPAIDDCDAATLDDVRPRDPEIETRLEEASALLAGGQLAGSLEVSRAALAAAEAAADPVAAATAHLVIGRALRDDADPTAHVELRAAAEAGVALGAWAVAAEAYANLVDDRAMNGDTSELEALLAAARTSLARVAAPSLRLELREVEIPALLTLGRPGEAGDACRQALSDGEQLYGARSHRLAMSLAYCADVDFARGDNEAALSKLERAHQLLVAELGADHPRVADLQHSIGIAHRRLGHLAEARRDYEAALAVREQVHGSDSPYVADSLNSLAIVLSDLGEHAAAADTAARALHVAEQAFGVDSRRSAAAHMTLATRLQTTGDLAGARDHAARAFAGFAGQPVEPDIELAHARIQWAELLLADHDPAAAAESAAAAVAILEPADDEALLFALAALGQAHLGRADPAAAIDPFERALALALAQEHGPPVLAELELGLARALWRSRRDRARATVLGNAARRRLDEVGAANEPLGQEIARWLAHPG